MLSKKFELLILKEAGMTDEEIKKYFDQPMRHRLDQLKSILMGKIDELTEYLGYVEEVEREWFSDDFKIL